MISDYDVEMSIKDYVTNQTKFNEVVEEFSDSKKYEPIYEALKKAKTDWVKSYGHPLIGWHGLTDEEALALVLRTKFLFHTGEEEISIAVDKIEMSPIPQTLSTIKDVHDFALKQLISVPKETVKVDDFADVIVLSHQIAQESRRGTANYILINPHFVNDCEVLMSRSAKNFTVVCSELMPKNKRCGLVVYSGGGSSNPYDSPVYNAVFDGTGYFCLNPDAERYVKKFEW